MQTIKKGNGQNKSLPSNILKFLKSRPDQMKAAKKANSWLLASIGHSFCGGTAIGKGYGTLVLDISYQGSDVYINEDGDITMHGVLVSDKKEFSEQLLQVYEVQE